MSDEDPRPGLQTATFSLYVHMALPERILVEIELSVPLPVGTLIPECSSCPHTLRQASCPPKGSACKLPLHRGPGLQLFILGRHKHSAHDIKYSGNFRKFPRSPYVVAVTRERGRTVTVRRKKAVVYSKGRPGCWATRVHSQVRMR